MDAKEVIQTLVALVGIVGFLFGVFQYRQAQQWKRLEFAASQLERLQSDPDLALASTFLDTSERGVPLPEKYWDFVGAHIFNHNCQTMYRAMAITYENTPEFFIYADVYSRLFGYLAQISAFIDMKLITVSDVKTLRWILQDLARPQWAADNRIFIGRISTEASDVLRLMDLFGIKHAALMLYDEIEALDREYRGNAA